MRQMLRDKPGLVTHFADALVQANAAEAAVALVTERTRGQHPDGWCIEWLAQYYRKHGPRRDAVTWQQRVFQQQPSVEAFQALRQIARKLGTWEQVRAEALTPLEESKRFGPLTQIALHEKDVGRALQLLPQMQPWERGHYRWEVAQAAEKSHPREALSLYQELVEQAIRGRDRRAYQRAAQHLKRMQAVYKALKAQSEWDAYLQALLAQYRHLPALQDELRQARL